MPKYLVTLHLTATREVEAANEEEADKLATKLSDEIFNFGIDDPDGEELTVVDCNCDAELVKET